MRAALLLLILVSSSLAGCAGGDGSQPASLPEAGQPTLSENTGAIQGSVTDDGLAPIPGAQVLLQETGAQTATDASGAFVISDLVPGAYTMFVAALGYESQGARRVEVLAGEITPVRVSLEPIAVFESYSHPMIFEGHMQCTWRGPTGFGPCFWGVYDASEVFTGNKRAFLYNIGPHMRSFVGELEWPSTSLATTNTMALYLSYANRSAAGSHFFGGVEGPSPLRQECARTEDEWLGCNGGEGGLGEKKEVSEDAGLYMRSFIATGRARPAGQSSPVNMGITLEQPFTLYVTVFYGDPAPPGFTARPDA